MGIRGLTKYINSNPVFMENYELRGGYLVIDGLAVAAELSFLTNCNCSFGGDLDKYAQRVAQFYDQLDKCDVIPLIIMDGGVELKKIRTINARSEWHAEVIATYNPALERETQIKIGPMAASMVFESVMKQKGAKIVRCIFEADASIAGVAKVLDAPVLSNDSDFYIFGVKYIPFATLSHNLTESSWRREYVIRCKIFRFEYLLKSFRCLKLSALPLTAVLLGNDYTPPETFKQFFQGLERSNLRKRLYNPEQKRIEITFQWLQNYDLDDATAAILSKMPKIHRRRLLHAIELVVNGYLILPCTMLGPLGLADKYPAKIAELSKREKFKFLKDIDTLDPKEFWSESQIVASIEDSTSPEEKANKKDKLLVDSDEYAANLIATWPLWFLRRYSTGYLPAYFVDLMFYGNFAVPQQMEDLNYPSAHAMSMKIVRVIYGLLVSGRLSSLDSGLSYVIRGEDSIIVSRQLEIVRGTSTTRFPTLDKLVETPINVRKQIFDDTLEISGLESLINDVPVQWRLYVIIIVYWMRQSDKPLRNTRHMHAVLVMMLLGVIDRKIEFYRSLDLFNQRYAETLAHIKSEDKNKKQIEGNNEGDSLLVEALNSVRLSDCIVAAPFFIEKCTLDVNLCDCPDDFNVTIVHVFSQLQGCTREAFHLNSLLGTPYKPPNIGDFYNGTMLYNLFTEFEKRSDFEAYIAETLEESPTILHLLNLLTKKVKEIIAAAPPAAFHCASADYADKQTSQREWKKNVLPVEPVVVAIQSANTESAQPNDLVKTFNRLLRTKK